MPIVDHRLPHSSDCPQVEGVFVWNSLEPLAFNSWPLIPSRYVVVRYCLVVATKEGQALRALGFRDAYLRTSSSALLASKVTTAMGLSNIILRYTTKSLDRSASVFFMGQLSWRETFGNNDEIRWNKYSTFNDPHARSASHSNFGSRCMDRSVAAIGATSGSLSAVLLRLLSETFTAPLGATLPAECPICPDCTLNDLLELPIWERVDLLSLLLGVGLGLLLGPLLDLCFLARQAWRAWIKSSLAGLAKRQKSEQLYRFA